MNYHGSEKKRALKAVKDQMLPMSIHSEKREQWLGDGVYLFEEQFYAYRWIVNMHLNNIKKKRYSENTNLVEKFAILGVKIEFDTEREFRISNPEHALVFYTILEELEKKERDNNRCRVYTDGEIFNFIFQKLGYEKEYDLVRCGYTKLTKDRKGGHIKCSQEIQICVKNTDIIKEIKDITDEVDLEKSNKLFNQYNLFQQRSGRYGKRKGNK